MITGGRARARYLRNGGPLRARTYSRTPAWKRDPLLDDLLVTMGKVLAEPYRGLVPTLDLDPARYYMSRGGY